VFVRCEGVFDDGAMVSSMWWPARQPITRHCNQVGTPPRTLPPAVPLTLPQTPRHSSHL
jgi:hypothetical protein